MATISAPKRGSKIATAPGMILARLRWQGARLARQLGMPLILAVLCLLAAGAFYWHGKSVLLAQAAAEQEIRSLQQKRAAQASKPQIDPAAADLARQLAQFYAFLPSHDALPDQIKRLLASAEKNGLTLAQADYKAQPQTNTNMLRYQIVLPVKGDYPRIANFLQMAMQELPSLTLEAAQFKRSSIEATELEARLQLVLLVQTKNVSKKAKSGSAQHE